MGYAQIAEPLSEQNSLEPEQNSPEPEENSPELEQNSLELEQKALARHVQSLNELTERRRTNRLFHNEQTPLHGQRIHYTNVGKWVSGELERKLAALVPTKWSLRMSDRTPIQGWRAIDAIE